MELVFGIEAIVDLLYKCDVKEYFRYICKNEDNSYEIYFILWRLIQFYVFAQQYVDRCKCCQLSSIVACLSQ